MASEAPPDDWKDAMVREFARKAPLSEGTVEIIRQRLAELDANGTSPVIASTS